MSNSAPDLRMLNVVVGDMPASLDFYRRLGIVVPGGEDTAGAHVQLRMPGDLSLELDTAESVRLWHTAWRADPASVSVVIGFSLPRAMYRGYWTGGKRGAKSGALARHPGIRPVRMERLEADPVRPGGVGMPELRSGDHRAADGSAAGGIVLVP